MTVTWHYVLDHAPIANPDDVRDVEQQFGVRFPADYLEIATKFHGASPEPSHIKLPDGTGTGFGTLLHFTDEPLFYNIRSRRWMLEDWLPDGVVPFADTSGDVWCFDFRANPAAPAIVYYQHDGPDLDFPPVATSFTDLLSKLKE
jgi:SMI1-KNR4 cell-wall